MSLRERRSQQWCRTEDVRTIKEGDMNNDRWRIETPPGIGNEEERAHKGVTHNKQEYNEDNLETRVTRLEEQTKWMYDRMTAAAAEPSSWNRGISWRYEDDGDELQRWEGSRWIPATLQAAVHLGRDYFWNLQSVKKQSLKSAEQLFRTIDKLIKEQTEITGLSTITIPTEVISNDFGINEQIRVRFLSLRNCF